MSPAGFLSSLLLSSFPLSPPHSPYPLGRYIPRRCSAFGSRKSLPALFAGQSNPLSRKVKDIRRKIFFRGIGDRDDGGAWSIETRDQYFGYFRGEAGEVGSRVDVDVDGSFRHITRHVYPDSGLEITSGVTFNAKTSEGWAYDTDGVARSLESDELEAVCLREWIRWGLWVSPPVTELLEISEKSPEFSSKSPEKSEKFLEIRLKGGSVPAVVRIGEYGPEEFEIILTHERWSGLFPVSNPRKIKRIKKKIFPSRTTTTSTAGLTVTCEVTSTTPVKFPEIPRIEAAYASFSNEVSPSVEWVRAWSGRIYIKAKVNGLDLGWWMLDSGLSRLIINEGAADTLRRESKFLELHHSNISSFINGEIYEGYVGQAEDLTIGPLSLSKPHLFVLPYSMLEPGVPGNVAGYVGYDLLHAAKIDITLPPLLPLSDFTSLGRRPPPVSGKLKVLPLDATIEGDITWQDINMAFRVPHVDMGVPNDWFLPGDRVIASEGIATVTKVIADRVHIEYEEQGYEKIVEKGKGLKHTNHPSDKVTRVRMLLDTGMGGEEAFQLNIDRVRNIVGIDPRRLGYFVGQASSGPVEPGDRIAVKGEINLGGHSIGEVRAELTNADTDKLSGSCGVVGIGSLANRRVIFDIANNRWAVL
ncbi:hypothetical protein AAMO2058_001412600 [Amorphochlora amoebiformis]